MPGQERTCVVCRAKSPKGELLRIGVVDGKVTVDWDGKMQCRGTYVHRQCCPNKGSGRIAAQAGVESLGSAPGLRVKLWSAALRKSGVQITDQMLREIFEEIERTVSERR